MASTYHDENGNLPTIDPRSPEQQLWDAIDQLSVAIEELRAAIGAPAPTAKQGRN